LQSFAPNAVAKGFPLLSGLGHSNPKQNSVTQKRNNGRKMKYTRLTKEQFQELHPEFINFLATQSIDKAEWDKLKLEKPEVAEQELDVFSDLVWEGVLSRAVFMEHFSNNQNFLFH
jgi:hypothetical protein